MIETAVFNASIDFIVCVFLFPRRFIGKFKVHLVAAYLERVVFSERSDKSNTQRGI